MRKLFGVFLIVLVWGLGLVSVVRAQETGLTISFSRTFGYSSGTGDIQGLFTITASGPDDLAKVVFYLDDAVLGEVDRPPFRLQFNTDNYPLGRHKVYAVGTIRGGRELKSQVVEANFVSPGESMAAAGRIAIPLLVIVFGGILLATLVPMLTGRRTVDLPAGTQRTYVLGGAVCPKCNRPFALHLYGVNLLGSKLDRCPYCGKWSLVRRTSLEQLRAAEQAELAAVADGSGQVQGLTEEEKLKGELDESRYHDL